MAGAWPGLQPTVGDVFWEGSKLDNTTKLTVAACNCRGSWHPVRASSSSDIQVEAVWTLGMRPADVPVRSGVLQVHIWRVLATVGQTSMSLQLDGALCMRHTSPQGSPTSHPHSPMHACVVSMCGAPAAPRMAAQPGVINRLWTPPHGSSASHHFGASRACLMTPASTPSTPTS